MPRIVAIDYGTKRTGLAVTDPLRIFATGLETVPSAEVLVYLRKYDEKEGIESFVIGMPKTLNNEPSENARFVSAFIDLLKKQFPEKTIFLIDERFTSSMALDAMIRGGMSKKDRKNKGNADRISATIILQSYLEMKR
ncbi:MAG TPA: Holliday junction resolvase RuvX [Cytophagaceae bacterium]|nr:Holliday junction resolvase RuvX [Cytophagaceae bacterium]